MPADTAHPLLRYPLLLWAGWVLGPLAWSLHLMVSYALVGWVCRSGHGWVLHAVTVATLVPALGGALIARIQWHAAGRANLAPRQVARTRLLAFGGMVVALLSAAVILAEEIANVVLSPCL